VGAVDKKRARPNCIHHLLAQIPYSEVQRPLITLPPRVRNPDYTRQPVPPGTPSRATSNRLWLAF
jgi:hypothetical protein